MRDRHLVEIEKLESERRALEESIERFERVDRPAFQSWAHLTFARKFKRLYRLEAEIARLESLIVEVERESAYYGLDEATSFRRVKRRHRRKEAPPWEGGDEDLFTDDDPYRRIYTQAFEAHGFSQEDAERMYEELKDRSKEQANERSSRGRAPTDDGPASPAAAPPDVKDLYRWLAKRLHPDLNPKCSPAERELWLETQRAYDAHDGARLADLRARVEMLREASREERQSLWDLMGLVKKLRSALRPLKQRIKSLRNDLAWDFSRSRNRERHKRVFSMHLDESIEELESRAEVLREQVKYWGEAA